MTIQFHFQNRSRLRPFPRALTEHSTEANAFIVWWIEWPKSNWRAERRDLQRRAVIR